MELMSEEKDMEEGLKQIRGRGWGRGEREWRSKRDMINNAIWRKA